MWKTQQLIGVDICERMRREKGSGEYHWLDLLWGGFSGADAPSVGTEKTVYEKTQ